MEYREYIDQNEPNYLLHDPDEVIDRNSWGRTFDGTASPCRESTFDFLKKIVSEIRKMYDEAGVYDSRNPPYLHIGGDEIRVKYVSLKNGVNFSLHFESHSLKDTWIHLAKQSSL